MRRREDDLFYAWEQLISPIVRDGAMPGYAAAGPKILFILKEVSSTTEPDLRLASSPEWYRAHGHWRTTWYAILRWSAALMQDPICADGITQELWQRILARIAVVNLKKTPGDTTADHRKIERFVRDEFNAGQLRAQLDLYKPDFTICGSDFVASCLEPLCSWTDKDWRSIKRGGSGDELCERDSPMLGRVISFWHPNQRSRKACDLVDMLEEIEADWMKGFARELGATRGRGVRSRAEPPLGSRTPS